MGTLIRSALIAGAVALAPAMAFAQSPSTAGSGSTVPPSQRQFAPPPPAAFSASSFASSIIPSGRGWPTSNAAYHWARPLNARQVRAILRADGYSNIRGLRFRGDHYTVAAARLHGRPVTDVIVGAINGRIYRGH
jgi:hypothetical protein